MTQIVITTNATGINVLNDFVFIKRDNHAQIR